MRNLKSTSFRLSLFFLVSFVAYSVRAQQQLPIKQLLNSYVEAKTQQRDVTSSLNRLNTVFKSMNVKQQKAFRDSIYSNLSEQQSAGKAKECMALIEVYKFFSTPDDKHLPELCFTQGEMAVKAYGDTVMLKESIADLLIFDTNKNPKVTEYIECLNAYLTDARNYVPDIKRIDGIWVSDMLAHESCLCQPSLILDSSGKGICVRMLNTSAFAGIFPEDRRIAEQVIDCGEKGIYLFFSSEKIKTTGEIWQEIAYDFVGDIANGISNAVTGSSTSLGKELLGGFAGDIFSGIFSGILSSLFAPSKYIYTIECSLKRVNDYEMISHMRLTTIKCKADSKPEITNKEYDFSFFKYNEDWKILLANHDFPLYIYPNRPLSKEEKKRMKTSESLIERVYIEAASDHVHKAQYFNIIQTQKLIYLCEQQMRSEGLDIPNTEAHGQVIPKLGFGMEELSKHPKEEKTAKFGVYISDVKPHVYNEKEIEKIVEFEIKNKKSIFKIYDKAIDKGEMSVEDAEKAKEEMNDMNYLEKKKNFYKEAFLQAIKTNTIAIPSYAILHDIKKGDVLQSIDGFEVNSPQDVNDIIESMNPYDVVHLKLLRGKKVIEMDVELTGVPL